MKTFNYWHLCLAIWLGMASLSCAQNKVTFELKEDEKLIEFTTDRFTLPNLHVTPDGESIIFDVLGDIYQVSLEGGKAKVLLQDSNWKRGGKLSPDGKTLAYVSDETGEFQVWTMDLDTKEKKVYPIKEYVHYPLNAYWGINNQLFIPSNEGLLSVDVAKAEIKLVRPLKKEEKNIMHTVSRKMTINKTGTYAYYQFDGALWAYDLKEKIDKYIGKLNEYRSKTLVNVSPNGRIGLYFTKSKSISDKVELILWNFETNAKQNLFKTYDLGLSTNADYSFDFIDDKIIILDKEGEIVRMDIETGEYVPIPIEVEVKKIIKKPLSRTPQHIKDSIITASVLRNPVTRKDLDTIYFGAFGKLHSYAKGTQFITEVYPDEDRFEVSPSLSPDGKYLAYTTWNDTEMGHVYAREVNTGKEYQLTETPGRYINPAWSPNGKEVVFVADETEAKMGIPRQSGGGNAYNYHLDLHKIKFFDEENKQTYSQSDTIYRIYPFSQLPKRFYPIPVYHPNGRTVIITTRNHEKDLPTVIEIDLETKKILQEKLIPFHTAETVVSPDNKHIAFVFDEQVWIDRFPQTVSLKYSKGSSLVNEKYHYKDGVVDEIILSKAKSIYKISPSYLSWQNEHTLMWGSADEVYTYDVRTGKTERIANIKVQKPKAIPKTQYALINARIITMNNKNEIIEKGAILIKNNRIKLVGKTTEIKIPENYKVFDLEGKTIIPGFIDVHAHYHHFPYEFQVKMNYNYLGNLAYGITTIYDPSVNVLDYREISQMVETGQVLGPRIYASGNIIDNHFKNYGYNTILSNSDTDKIVKSNKKLLVHGPLKQYDRKNRIHRKWLLESAKKYNMTITNHETNFILAMTQIIDGYTAMEHEKYTFPLQKDIFELIGQSEIHYTPTYIVSPGINKLYAKKTINERNKLLKFNDLTVYEKDYKSIYENINLKNYSFEVAQSKIDGKEHARALDALKNIINSGGTISVGGHGNPLPGIGTHWELWFMAKGISNYKAIQAATINGAKKIDLQEELGSIENGKLADLVILNSNPLIDIYNTVDILYTIQNGNIFEAETMQQIHIKEK